MLIQHWSGIPRLAKAAMGFAAKTAGGHENDHV